MAFPFIDFAMLSEMPDPALLPWLDQPALDESKLTPYQLEWRRTGINILPKFMPDDLIDAYAERRARLGRPHGWGSPVPYL